MEGLEGTVKTPLGTVSKKTALLVGGGVVVLAGIVYFRSSKAKKAAAIAASGANTGINPATGYAYGSAEDAAALANQASYISPGGGGSGSGSGGGGYPTGPGRGFTNNAEWVQATITYMVQANLVSDPSVLSAALGRYITGSPVIGGDATLINMAIAANGYPPVSGGGGYPPGINTSHPVTPPVTPPDTPPGTPPATPPTVAKLPPPSVFYDEGPQWTFALVYRWSAVPGASSYVLSDGAQEWNAGNTTGWQRSGLVHNGSYFTKIATVNSAGVRGDWSQTLVSHTKN